MKKYDDPVDEIHAIRRRLAKESGYDIYEYVRRLQVFEEELRREGRIKFVESDKQTSYPTMVAVRTKKVAEGAAKYSAKKRASKKKEVTP